MQLLRKEELVVTGPLDHADWNYRPVLGFVSKKRFALVSNLCDGKSSARTLEIGYGSGVFMPELAKTTGALYGLDLHERGPEIEKILRLRGVSAKLLTGTIEEAPFADGFFDRVVAVSALEFVPDLERARSEILRILSKGGHLIVVAPRASAWADALLGMATGKSAAQDFGDRREKLRPVLERKFELERVARYPFLPFLTIYEGLKFKKFP